MNTLQKRFWVGAFAKGYKDRNTFVTAKALDKAVLNDFGISRSALNKEFVGKLNRNIRILEVGSNIGGQLINLRNMGFENLYGIELNPEMAFIAKKQGLNVIVGDGFDIPFKDEYFDLVFTSGVLIHITPKNIKRFISEIHRCSKKYIWGYEYHAEKYTHINYRGYTDVLWKTDFPMLYLDTFKDLRLVKRRFLRYLSSPELVDVMFLLKKKKR